MAHVWHCTCMYNGHSTYKPCACSKCIAHAGTPPSHMHVPNKCAIPGHRIRKYIFEPHICVAMCYTWWGPDFVFHAWSTLSLRVAQHCVAIGGAHILIFIHVQHFHFQPLTGGSTPLWQTARSANMDSVCRPNNPSLSGRIRALRTWIRSVGLTNLENI